MARQRSHRSNALVASAVRKRGARDFLKHSKSGKEWQQQAWGFYNSIGEYRYACDWVGSMLSKATLYATREENGKVVPVTNGTAYEVVDRLFGDRDGKAEMLRSIGIHFTVAGECYLVGWEDPDTGRDEWMVAAATTLKDTGTYISVDNERIAQTDQAVVFRLWRGHPEDPNKAHSPSRAVLPILAEISKLTQHVSAQIDSRLAGAGILLMPSEMTLPPNKTDDDAESTAQHRSANTASELMDVIQDVASTAIEDRGDASALVPIVITAPAEAIEAVRHVTFWTELDKQAIELRDEAIRRLALGMDMPPEVLQGNADSNHWAAWQADESAIKAHTEPLLKVVTSVLAKEYLRPVLDQYDVENIDHYSIGANTSEMRLRPNRSKEAFELYDRGELSGRALLRETGFDPDEDTPKPDDMKTWLTRKVAQGSTTPDLVAAALRALGVDLGDPEPDETPVEGRPSPSLLEHPERDIPDRERSERRKAIREGEPVYSALTAAADQIVWRALERAGNRMKNKIGGKIEGLAACDYYLAFTVSQGDMDFYLSDAWGQNLTAVAERHGIDETVLSSALDAYCRSLMATQSRHTYERLDTFLSQALEVVAA